MADSSVALGINAPDPNQGLNTLASILSLGSKGLAIRGQQSENISKASEATVAQQGASENQNLARLISDPVKNGIANVDGSPTDEAKNIYMRAAPTTWGQHYENLVKAATAKVQFNSAVNDLRTSERAEIANTVAGAASGAQAPSDVTNAIDTLIASKQGTPEYGNYQTIGATAKQAINHLANSSKANSPVAPGQEPWRVGALNIGRSVLPASGTVGAAGIAAPQATQIDTGGNVQPGVTAPALAGGGFTRSGEPIGKTLAPTQKLPYVKEAAAASTAGQVGAHTDEDLYTQITDAAKKSSQIRSLAKDVEDLASMTQTGPLTGGMASKWATLKNTLGFQSSADDFETRRQVLGKMAAQLRIQSEMAAGASTDAARSTTASALPHPEEMNSAATKIAAQYVAGQAAIAAARGNMAAKQRAANNGSSDGLRAVDQQFMQDADPNQYIYRDLKPGAERQEFLRRKFVGADGKVDADGMRRFKETGDRLNYHGAP
jgi:hypothetical protein